MKVYVVNVDPNDYDNMPYNYGVYSTKEKAEQVIQQIAIEAQEPALLLEVSPNEYVGVDCWHYPNYEGQCYYIQEWELE